MPENTLLELANTMMSTPLGLFFFYLLVKEWRFPPKVMRWLRPLFLIFICGVLSSIFLLVDDFLVKRIAMTACSCIFGLLFVFSTTNYRNGRVLFIAFTDFSLLLIGAVFAECIGSTSSLHRLLIKLFINLLLSLFIVFLFRPALLQLLHEAALNWYKLSIIPLLFALLLLLLLIPGRLYYDWELQVIGVALAVALCLCYAAIYHIFRTLKDSYTLQADSELLRAQMNALQSQTAMLQQAYDQMRIFRHDMRHYMQIQSTCLESGDLDGARQLLSTMEENLDAGFRRWTLRSYTGQPLIDAVLSRYAVRAQQERISLTISCHLPEVLPAEQGDLAVMLSNALENAFHACLHLPAGVKREIHLQGIQAQQQFLLAVSNSFVGHVEFDPISHLPVTHKAGHGYGTQSIAAFAKRYGGLLDYSVKDGQFALRLLFPPAGQAPKEAALTH